MTSSSLSLTLDGVEFKLSDAFKVNSIVELPPNFDMKDPARILENCEYDFSFEHNLIAIHVEQERKIRENEERERQNKEILKLELAEKHRLFLLQKEKQDQKVKENNSVENESTKIKLSSSNPFLSMIGNDILTPQKYTNDKHDAPQRCNLDVHEFENENQDPFSNMELQSMDDLKELKDVLQNVTMSGVVGTSGASTDHKSSSRIRRHSPTDMNKEITVKVTKRADERSEDDVGTSSYKMEISNEVADTLTDEPPEVQDLSIPSPEKDAATTKLPNALFPLPQFQPVSDIARNPPVTSVKSMPSLDHTGISTSPVPSPVDRVLQLPSTKITPNSGLSSKVQSNGVVEAIDATNSSDGGTRQPPAFLKATENKPQTSSQLINSTEHEYENLPLSNKSSSASEPLPRTLGSTNQAKTSQSDNKLKTKETQSSTYGAVKNKVFANKSVAERAKFEETINKALTSLPQLPQIVVKKQSHHPGKPNSSGPNLTKKSSEWENNSILSGLSPAERNFVESIVSMGFVERDVIRTMQKYGEDHKEVLDHLFKVQCLSEKGFSTESIEEALGLFDGNEEEAAKYLTLERQFLDMGFSCDRVKQALLLHDRDQTKALEELMSGV